MIQAKIINRINFPKITLQDDLEKIASGIIIPDIVMGIESRKAINGGSLPTNDPQTIKRKGHDRPLINTGELRSSFYYERRGKSKVFISIRSGRKDIGGYLQIDGITTKAEKKFYRFFGVSNDAHDSAMDYMREKIKEITNDRHK